MNLVIWNKWLKYVYKKKKKKKKEIKITKNSNCCLTYVLFKNFQYYI